MVKTLDRYVFKEALKLFALTITTLLVLFSVIDFIGNIDLFMKIGMDKGVSYVLGRLPLYAVRVIPVAMFISSLTTLSKFSSTSELTVVKSLGISIYRFSIPVIVLSIFVSLFSLSIQQFLLPQTLSKAKEIKSTKASEKELIGGSVWFRGNRNEFIYFDSFNPEKLEAKRVSIIELSKSSFTPLRRIDALSGKNISDGIWEIEKCYIRDFKGSKFLYKDRMELNLGVNGKELMRSAIDPETMGILELYLISKRFERIGYNSSPLKVEMFSKMALSFLPFVVTFLGIPLGVYNPRNRKSYTVLIAAILVALMWITISFFLSLGKSGVLPPSYSAFAPPFIFLAIGLILFARTET